jgi:hypothetical protein
MPTADSYERLANAYVKTRQQTQKRQPRPTPQPVAPTPARRESRTIFGQPVDYDRNARQGRGFFDFLNPAPSLTSAVAEGRAPRPADAALDAGLFAAGFIPFAGLGIRGAGQAARPALETGEAIAERRNDLERLLNDEGPQAINEFLRNPLTGYLGTLNWSTLNKFFRETPERIPRGTEMFRAPSKGEVQSRLPREIGAVYAPGTVRSAGGPADLQKLGDVLEGKKLDSVTGGNQSYAPGLASITAMDDLPGILDINEFLARYAGQYGGQGRPAIGSTVSNYSVESVLGPQVRYSVRDFQPGINGVPPTWYLNAYAR